MIGVVDPILQSVSGAASPYLSCETYICIYLIDSKLYFNTGGVGIILAVVPPLELDWL